MAQKKVVEKHGTLRCSGDRCGYTKMLYRHLNRRKTLQSALVVAIKCVGAVVYCRACIMEFLARKRNYCSTRGNKCSTRGLVENATAAYYGKCYPFVYLCLCAYVLLFSSTDEHR